MPRRLSICKMKSRPTSVGQAASLSRTLRTSWQLVLRRRNMDTAGQPGFGRLDRPACLTTRVEQMLRQAIGEGRFPEGRLPTEVELAKQLGVSRETVRLAAESLQREGLLVKIRRKGTFLKAPQLPESIEAAPATALGYLQASYPG